MWRDQTLWSGCTPPNPCIKSNKLKKESDSTTCLKSGIKFPRLYRLYKRMQRRRKQTDLFISVHIRRCFYIPSWHLASFPQTRRSTGPKISARLMSEFHSFTFLLIYMYLPAVYTLFSPPAIQPLFISLLFCLSSKEKHEKHLCCRSFGVALAGDMPSRFSSFRSVMPFLRSTQGPAGCHPATLHSGPLRSRRVGLGFTRVGLAEKSANDSKPEK